MDKGKLGKKYSCFKCGCKFYDLKRAKPTCPKCGANQTEAPKQEQPPSSRFVGTRPKPRRRREEAFEPETDLVGEDDSDEDLGEDLSLIEDDDLLEVEDDEFQDDN